MSLRQSLLEAIGESCVVARPKATQPRNFYESSEVEDVEEVSL